MVCKRHVKRRARQNLSVAERRQRRGRRARRPKTLCELCALRVVRGQSGLGAQSRLGIESCRQPIPASYERPADAGEEQLRVLREVTPEQRVDPSIFPGQRGPLNPGSTKLLYQL